MPKKTRLGDDALIYQPHRQQTEKEKLSEMPFKGKMGYIWEYYKLHIFGAVAVIALIIYFIYTVNHPTPSAKFYAAMINNSIDENVLKQYSDEFAKDLALNPKREAIEFNTSFYFTMGDSVTLTLKQALMAYIQAKEVDVIIAPESQFYEYSYGGLLSKLSDQLPTDIYSSLADKFYLSDTEDDSQKNAYGIYLSDTKLYKENANNSDPYVLGIVGNAPHEDNTIEFIKFLFQKQ